MTPYLRPHVLVVDNDHDTADSLADLLKLYGYTTSAAYCAAQALSLATAHPAHAVVCDVWMSTDGCALACELIEVLTHRPLMVAVTGAEGQSDRCRAAGFDHVLMKPAEPATLTALLSRPLLAMVAA